MDLNTNVIGITTTIDTNFFNYWIRFLQPIHRLSEKEMVVLFSLVKERYYLSQVILDDDILNKILFSDETKKKIIKSLNTKDYCFNNILSKLRKKRIIVNTVINNKLIPYINPDAKSFELIVHFNLQDGNKDARIDNKGSQLGD